MHFKYSKQFLNTYIIAFILLYYITCILIRTSNFAVEKANDFIVISVNIIVELFTFDNDIYSKGLKMATKSNKFSEIFFSNIKSYIIIATCLTTAIYVVQLFLGIRTYQKHVLDAYKGIYVDIPSPKRFSSVKKTVHSLHFSGFMIGYLLWGYLILFEVTIAFIIIVKFLLKFYFILEKIAKIFLPILVMFFLKRFLIWYISRFFLVHKSNRFFLIKSPKLYFITFHFNFFFDCFLGSFVSLMRMAKSSLAALFFMPRLDYSVFGRMLERADIGYLSYVNFIHLEVNQTNPIKMAFAEILLKGVSLRNFIKSVKGISSEELRQIQKSQNVKKRWLLALTLARNPVLIKCRKTCLKNSRKVPKVESLERFLERNVKFWVKTKSTSSLCNSNAVNKN